MTYIPTECEVALLSLRASTVCHKCADCQQHAARLRQTADEDARRCLLALTQLTQRELSILCTDAYQAALHLKERLCDAHPDAGVIDAEESQAAGLDAAATLADIYQRLHALLGRAITPSEKAQEWVKLHTEGDGDPQLCRAITASDCTLGRLEP